MTELHLEGASTAGQRHDLVPQTNAKSRDTAVDQLGSGGNRVLAGLRVTWTVAQKNTVGPVGQHSRRRGLGRHHRDPTAALGKHAQDVLLDSKIIGQHMVGRLRLLAIAGLAGQAGLGQAPLGLAPCIGGRCGHQPRQVQPSHAGRCSSQGQRTRNQCRRERLARREAQNAAILCTLAAELAGQLAGVYVGDGHGTLALQVIAQRHVLTEIGGQQRQVLDDQAGGINPRCLHILRIHAVIANMGVGQGDNLLAVAGVSQDFLVASHGGVEHHFSDGSAGDTNRIPGVDAAIRKCQNGWRGSSLERQKHRVLRLNNGYAQSFSGLAS